MTLRRARTRSSQLETVSEDCAMMAWQKLLMCCSVGNYIFLYSMTTNISSESGPKPAPLLLCLCKCRRPNFFSRWNENSERLNDKSRKNKAKNSLPLKCLATNQRLFPSTAGDNNSRSCAYSFSDISNSNSRWPEMKQQIYYLLFKHHFSAPQDKFYYIKQQDPKMQHGDQTSAQCNVQT